MLVMSRNGRFCLLMMDDRRRMNGEKRPFLTNPLTFTIIPLAMGSLKP